MSIFEKKNKGKKIEILLHGLHHTLYEFGLENSRRLKKLISDGLAILKKAIPEAKIETFIPPYDFISHSGIKSVLSLGLNLCTDEEMLTDFGSRRFQRLFHRFKKEKNLFCAIPCSKSVVFCTKIYLLDPLNSPEYCMDHFIKFFNLALQDEKIDLIIFVNHYWSFYKDWKEPNRKWFTVWNGVLDIIYSNSKCKITTFSEYAEKALSCEIL